MEYFQGLEKIKTNNCFGYLNINYSVHSKGKAKVMTETMETMVFYSLHSSHLEILTVNMDILLVVMLQFKPHMICILKLLPNNVFLDPSHTREQTSTTCQHPICYCIHSNICNCSHWHLDCKTFINYNSESVALFLRIHIWQCPTSFHTHHHLSSPVLEILASQSEFVTILCSSTLYRPTLINHIPG